MRIRQVACCLVLFALPAIAQQGGLPTRNAMWVNRDIRPEPLRPADVQAARIQAIHQDAEQLAVVNAALQTDLQQLKKGLLPKTLADNLKKVEKLSKKLRQEILP